MRASPLESDGTTPRTDGCARRSRRDSRCRARASCSRPSRTLPNATTPWCTHTRPRTATRWRWSAACPEAQQPRIPRRYRPGDRTALCAAHCVWVTDREQGLLAERDVKVLHCPGSNLKLGSGIAPVAEMRARGISVSLGADGAACNNRLDMFQEMRLAATLQAVRREPGRADGPRCALDGDPRRGAGARPGRRDRLDRSRQARRPDPGRSRPACISRRIPIRGRPSSTPPRHRRAPDDGGRRDPGRATSRLTRRRDRSTAKAAEPPRARARADRPSSAARRAWQPRLVGHSS